MRKRFGTTNGTKRLGLTQIARKILESVWKLDV